MASHLWRKYADYVYSKWEKTTLWGTVEPNRRPKSFNPLVTVYIFAFYTGVIGSAITEQLHKEKYWEDHPGEAVPLMKPKFYSGPWKVLTVASGFIKFRVHCFPRKRSGSDRASGRDGHGKRWSPFTQSPFPSSFADSLSRIRTNAGYFLTNYAIIVLFALFLSLLSHPISLIVFFVTMAAWLFFYFLRDEPLVIFNRVIDDRVVLIVLSVVTIVSLFLTHATVNIVVGLVVGAVVVLVHGALRRTDDLLLDEEEGVGSGVGWRSGGAARMLLKETASSSFSSSA
ncbi:hypothetical protein F0562_009661 [Nyssa sinensis]|uniref:PRA1 family protein n=1 Tax=Nyssa sinensis TaxID=561372 RepID=A0A5J4ZZW4_9ASTE|nr:hypothetical protein F0562_009661 [Nyssa sinensis]